MSVATAVREKVEVKKVIRPPTRPVSVEPLVKADRVVRTVRPERAKPVAADVTGVVAEIRGLLGVTQEEFARLLGYSTRSVAGWEARRQAIGTPARLKLTETVRLARALTELMPKGAVGEWLRKPNPAFEGSLPLHLIERGESDRLWEMVHQIDANVAN